MKTLFSSTQAALRHHVSGAIERGKGVAIVGIPGISPSEHEKSEWSRMAQDAYARDFNDTGHKFSVAASLGRGAAMPLAQFDALQTEYRQWLIRGFAVQIAATGVQS